MRLQAPRAGHRRNTVIPAGEPGSRPTPALAAVPARPYGPSGMTGGGRAGTGVCSHGERQEGLDRRPAQVVETPPPAQTRLLEGATEGGQARGAGG